MPPANVQSDRSLGELMGEMTAEFSLLVRKELELARAEIREEIGKAGKAGGMFGGGAVAGYMALVLLSFAAAWGLAAAMPRGVAFLLVGLVYAAAAAVLYMQGRKKLAEVNAVPQQTVETVKEDVEWAKAQTR